MKINVDEKLKDVRGKPLKNGPEPDEGKKDKRKGMILSDVIIESMLGVLPEEKESMSGKDKLANFEIAQKAAKGGSVDFKGSELETIKERIGKFYFPNIVGPCWQIFAGAGKKK